MNAWIKFSMKNAGVIFIAMLMILAGGLYSKMNMKMEEMPNVDIPYLNVVVIYPGATPDQALEDVGKPLEQALSSIKGLKTQYVSSGNDYVAATLEFEMDKSMDEAQKDINSALASVKLPEGAQKPKISTEGPNAAPVYSFGITAAADQATIQQYIDDKIKPVLSTVQGISSIDISGTSEKKVYIKVDPDKLKEHNLTLSTVKQMLQANNIGIPAGQLTLDGKDLNVEVRKKINSLEDAKNIQLVVVDQDMSALTDAFKSVGSGFSAVGSNVGKMGQGIGNLTKGQMILQGQMQLIQGISGLTTKIATENLSAQNLDLQIKQNQLLLASTTDSTMQLKLSGLISTLQTQLDGLRQVIAADTAQLSALQAQLSGLQAQVQASGTDTANLLQGLGNSASGVKSQSEVSAVPTLNIKTIKLSDIADVKYEPGRDMVITRLNGKQAVVVNIKAQAGSNVVDLVNQINSKLDKLNLPKGYELTKLRDSSVQVKKSVNTMQREAILGAVFAMLITFVFLRNWRSTIVAILAIPLSIFASLITLYWLDYSLNVMTLAGIAVAVGRVVDDSIVVIENIYRRVRSSDTRSSELVREAAKEVGKAVTSSTITTVAVFAPLMFVPGIVGRFFRPFGITVVVSIIFSLLVAISVVPLLSRLFLLNIKHKEHKENGMQRVYRSLLTWSLNHKLIIILIATVLLGGSLALAGKIPQNFLPSEKTVSYSLQVTMPVGTAAVKTDQAAAKVEEALRSRTDLKSYQTSVRGEALTMQLELKDEVTAADTKRFEQDLKNVTDGLGSDVESALTPLGMATGYGGLFMVLNGSDLNALKQAGDEVISAIKDVPGLADVKTNLSAVKPQLSIDVNPEEAAKKGLNPALVAMTVRQMINGDSVMNVTLDGRTTDVNLGLKVDNLENLDVLRNQLLTNMTGEQVKLSDVATVSVKPGPTSINRLNQQEYVSVTGRFTTENSSGVQKEVDSRVKLLNLPEGVTYYYEGESKAMADGFKNLALAMVGAVLLVYMVMLVAFGEMLAPLAILFSLPFIFVGGLTGLYLSHESLGIPALVGFLMLIGIVVTNAIVFVDRVIQNRDSGMDTQEALVEGGVTRLRPILMTAVATVCALLPLAVSQEGGLISRSLAIVVISGLAASTILTLVIVPVAYQFLDSARSRIFGIGKSAVQEAAK